MEKLNNLKQKISEHKRKQESKAVETKNKNFSAITVSSEIIGAVIFGFIIGNFFDTLFNTRFIFKLLMLLLAMMASFYTIYKSIK